MTVIPFEEILSGLNMPEFNLENEEVLNKAKELREKYLPDEFSNSNSRVWKILLKQRSQQIGEENLYNELKEKCISNEFDMVSINTFKNSWINLESASNRTSYKHLKIICDLLGLKKDYFRFLRVYCSTEANTARVSTIFHTELITDVLIKAMEKEMEDEINYLFFELQESQKDSLLLMGIPENKVQKELEIYLKKLKKNLKNNTRQIKSIIRT